MIGNWCRGSKKWKARSLVYADLRDLAPQLQSPAGKWPCHLLSSYVQIPGPARADIQGQTKDFEGQGGHRRTRRTSKEISDPSKSRLKPISKSVTNSSQKAGPLKDSVCTNSHTARTSCTCGDSQQGSISDLSNSQSRAAAGMPRLTCPPRLASML
jgi:hypothetical protein